MTDSLLERVRTVLVTTLGIEDRGESLGPASPLFGAIPELDSLGVMELVVNLEERFGITIDDEEFSGEIFETLGSLTGFVQSKIASEPA